MKAGNSLTTMFAHVGKIESFMADRTVVDALIEGGSDPEKEHFLEYAFDGNSDGLTVIAQALQARGYQPVGDLDVESGLIVLAKRLPLDLSLIVNESLANLELAEQSGAEFNGWGAAIVE